MAALVSAVDERLLGRYQFDQQDIRLVDQLVREVVDLSTPRMAPPRPADRRAGYQRDQARQAGIRHKHEAVALKNGQKIGSIHVRERYPFLEHRPCV